MNNVLLMFSGGKDSFLAACKLVEEGYHVKLIMFNGGCIIGDENGISTAQRLVNKYGERVEIEGVRASVGTRMRVERPWKEMKIKELIKEFPDVNGVQSQCFFCQTSMWLEAIAYCLAKDIKHIACGYKSSDMFCTGSYAYIDMIKKLCINYEIELKLPMWYFDELEDLSDARNLEMAERWFMPAVIEPQCTVGVPVDEPISDPEMGQLIFYFKTRVEYDMIITKLKGILKHIKLTDKAWM